MAMRSDQTPSSQTVLPPETRYVERLAFMVVVNVLVYEVASRELSSIAVSYRPGT